MANNSALLIGFIICLSATFFLEMPYRIIAFFIGLLLIILGGLVEEVRKEPVEIIEPVEVVDGTY